MKKLMIIKWSKNNLTLSLTWKIFTKTKINNVDTKINFGELTRKGYWQAKIANKNNLFWPFLKNYQRVMKKIIPPKACSPRPRAKKFLQQMHCISLKVSLFNKFST